MAETPSRIEPCLIGDHVPLETAGLIAELIEKSLLLKSSLHPRTAECLSSIVRKVNCHYSNLIEGHNLSLEEIERALNNDFDVEKRNLQIEALAHIAVQSKIEKLYADDMLPNPTSCEFIKWLHKEFYANATDEMLTIKSGGHSIIMVPGEFRSTENVTVGRHTPPSGQDVESFMRYFENRYSSESHQILAIAAAHHRFAYIHPFLDGNGRVGRLMSHAMGLQAGIGRLWSISRGLALGCDSQEYQSMMDYADMPRQGDLDGRGNLSLKALIGFTNWFLKISIGQIDVIADLFDVGQLNRCLGNYVDSSGFKPESIHILTAALINGEMPRVLLKG